MNKDKLELQSEFEQHKKAALNGSALDMWSVGQYYEHGYLGPKNLKEAIQWYRIKYKILHFQNTGNTMNF